MTQKPPTRNPWPVAIAAYFVVFITFLASFIVFAMRQHADLVRADYYEEELRFQQQLDRVQHTREAGGPLSVAYDARRQCITLALPSTGAAQAEGRIHLYRPSDARLDQQVPLGLDSSGTQRLDASKLERGLWKVRVEWSLDGKDYYLDQKVVVHRGPAS
jgi:hypothetical protein